MLIREVSLRIFTFDVQYFGQVSVGGQGKPFPITVVLLVLSGYDA